MNVKKRIMLLSLILLSMHPFAMAAEGECPKKPDMVSLCRHVNFQTELNDASINLKYQYQKDIFDAACADPNKKLDEELEAEYKKIRDMWSKYRHEFICGNGTFNNVVNGNVLKLAVNRTFGDFIEDVANRWAIDLNEIDDTDGQTVLDYTEALLKNDSGSALISEYKRYIKIFKENDAKHASELPKK